MWTFAAGLLDGKVIGPCRFPDALSYTPDALSYTPGALSYTNVYDIGDYGIHEAFTNSLSP